MVETIDFTTADESTELPVPSSIHDLENMTLAQKRMASQVNEVPLSAAEHAAFVQDEQAEQAQEDGDEEERKRIEEEEKEKERKREVQRKFVEGQGNMKIRKDYVPKCESLLCLVIGFFFRTNCIQPLFLDGNLKARQPTIVAPTTICSYCGQAIPIDEITEHIRIELLDPKWKERKEALDARKTQAGLLQQGSSLFSCRAYAGRAFYATRTLTLLSLTRLGADVSASLRELASARTDMFGSNEDEQARKIREEEERQQRKEREKKGWDGHTASKVSTLDKFQQNANFDEQIAAIHRAKGLSQFVAFFSLSLCIV